MASSFFTAVAAAVLFGRSFAGNFLAMSPVKVEELEASFLASLAQGVGHNTSLTTKRLDDLEAELRTMFASVPKDADGTLSHNVVRYVLQRYFARRHGWYIHGLEVGNASGTNSSNTPMQKMQEWVPGYLQDLLERMIGGRGVNLRELAVFAATMEDLVHKEEKGHLLQAYEAIMERPESKLEQQKAFELLQTYMMIYMLGGNWTVQMATQVDRLMGLFAKKVSHWDDTLVWLKQLLAKNEEDQGGAGLDLEAAQRIARNIGDRYNGFNDGECGRLKSELMKMESAKPGRVRLVDFYKAGLHGAWEFNEKIDFLRAIGTLDESDPSTPLVILPNYVQSRSNCLSVSGFYAVCCRNECESLMERVESEIVSSTARPSQISKLVSKLSSSSVTAPRQLPKPLMQKLQDVASQHGGQVPVHGRLFAQWMHHAFPRECPYPHSAGTTSQLSADEWMQATGQEESKLTEGEVMKEIASDNCRLLPKGVDCGGVKSQASASSEEDEELPWDSNEELLVVRSSPPPPLRGGLPMNWLTDILLMAVLSSVVYGFYWVLRSTNLGIRLSIMTGVPPPSAAMKADKCCV